MKHLYQHILTVLARLQKTAQRFFHRLFLITKPAYRRHRTEFQKQFDIKLQYTFVGCLIGILSVALTSYYFSLNQRQQTVESTEELVQPKEEKSEALIQNTPHKISSLLLTLNKRETLSGLLKRADVSMADALASSQALDIVFDVRKLRPGQGFEIFFLEPKNLFQGFRLETNKGEMISVLKNELGEFIPESKEGIIENKRFTHQGIITSTFSEEATQQGIPQLVVRQVILALDGQINFKKDLKTGEPFKLIYEQKMTETGKEIGKPLLLYVSLTTHKKNYQRYFFIDGIGTQRYYDENGISTAQTLMQRPLGKGRISSPFGMRKHPILGYKIHHNGVDFPAKIGTPIPAGADGIIQRIGRNGGYGKYIKIKHSSTYSTAYGHMSGYQQDLKKGSYVKKGEIIGYVGNTGRSTGPHLHYEVIKKGRPVNPLKKYSLPERVLKNQSLIQFNKKKQMIDSLWEKDKVQKKSN